MTGLLKPELLAHRFAPPIGVEDISLPAHKLAIAIAVALIALGLVPLLESWLSSERARRWLRIVATVCAYLALCSALSDWMIDDAAITFAYSENLVRGYGLTLHPSLPREEAYSNTLWMLWLAALRFAGIAVPIAAKYSCLAVGSVTILAVHLGASRLNGERLRSWLLPSMVLFGAPYLVWSCSGLEHGLQGLSIVLCALWPLFDEKRAPVVSGLSLAALVLVRPEAPLIVMACTYLYVYYTHQRTKNWLTAAQENWAVAVIPGAVWVALIAFRLAYFGDPLANPYYVKASDATFARLLNVVGGGWEYVYAWAFGSGIFIALPIVIRACAKQLPKSIAIALGLSATHLAFVLYARGDWMGCWRFICPIIPSLAFVIAWAYSEPEEAASNGTRLAFAHSVATVSTLVVLALGSFRQYLTFLATPTTPYEVVAKVGQEFVDLGKRLGLNDPVLAHHDAGGTSYAARIKLLDLGGLGNRAIAKHMNDAEFLTHYILDDAKPDFVFGVARNFAAGRSLFWQRPQFETDYVRVEFPGKPYMKSDLSYIKRTLVEKQPLPPGIELERQGSLLASVIVK
ncbi:MAG TPA: hypothetical protein VHM70_01240 [Polyangiaceae bacterium]|nr:hypothetical protein [Polyangiaceae bacterium]